MNPARTALEAFASAGRGDVEGVAAQDLAAPAGDRGDVRRQILQGGAMTWIETGFL